MTKYVSTILIVLISLVSGCASGPFNFGQHKDETERFPTPVMDAKHASEQLKERLVESENELNTLTEQIGAVQPFVGKIDDPQLQGALDLLNSRKASFQERVDQLAWRVRRAEDGYATESREDFSSVVNEAPLPLSPAKIDAKHTQGVLETRLLQFKREIDALSLHIGAQAVASQLNGNDRDLRMQSEADERNRADLSCEYLKVQWRHRVAQVAVNRNSKLDYGYLLTQPEAGLKRKDALPTKK